MAVVTMKQLLEAGVQFGHQTRRWNPKMRRFIHGDKAGIHIVDLRQTLAHLERAYVFVRDLVADGGTVLFIGTKKQAQDSIQSYAERCNMPYVNERWQGGMLTNFHTIAKRIAKMKEYQRMRDSGEFAAMPKKEALQLGRELIKLERNLGGIRDMREPPGAVFILDTKKEYIAVTEARKLQRAHRRRGGHELRPRSRGLRHSRQRRRHPLRAAHGPGDLRRGAGGPVHPLEADRGCEHRAAMCSDQGRGRRTAGSGPSRSRRRGRRA